MSTLPIRPRRAVPFLLLAGLAWAGCSDVPGPAQVESPRHEPVSAAGISEVWSLPSFLWLDPLVEGIPPGPLATGLSPEVRIIQNALGIDVRLIAQERDNSYQALWDTDKDWATEIFTIEVRLDPNDQPVASLFATLERGGSTNAGRTIPVQFWIGTALPEIADCVGDDRCNAGGVPTGGDPQIDDPTLIETYDEYDRLMAVISIPAGAAPVPLNIVLDCREDGYLAGDGPLPTDLDQWPLFCNVDARELDGTPFEGQLNSAARIEICVVDEDYNPDYHGFFDHSTLLLGKSPSGPNDAIFEFLPYVETQIISGCDGIALSSQQVGFLDRLKAPIDGLLKLVGPQPLNAAAFRRDGGVGGTLTAFSDINPVSPAYIEGVVFGGTTGATVTLSGGGLSLSTTVAANGGYSFGPLPVPVGGVDYTVTVGQETADVTLTGSGIEQVDFVLLGTVELQGFGQIYDAVTLDGPNGPVNLTDARAPFFTNTYTGCSITQPSTNPWWATSALTTTPGLSEPNTGWGRGNDVNPRVEYLATLTLDVLVPLGTDRLEIIGYIDNDARVFVRGQPITATVVPASGSATFGRSDTYYDAQSGWFIHGGCADLAPNVPLFTAASGTFTPGMVNTLTFEVRDYGTVGYADFQVTAVAAGAPPVP